MLLIINMDMVAHFKARFLRKRNTETYIEKILLPTHKYNTDMGS